MLGDSMKKEIFANKIEKFHMSNKYQVLKDLPTISRFYQNSEEHRIK